VIIVGIDIGITGAIAALEGRKARVFDMPTYERDDGKRRVDRQALVGLLHRVAPTKRERKACVAFVERANAGPDMGSSAAFNFGMGYGMVQGVLADMGVRICDIAASKWKPAMGVAKSKSAQFGSDEQREQQRDKEDSLKLARKLFPRLAGELERKKHDGRAEALLIAEYGRRELAL